MNDIEKLISTAKSFIGVTEYPPNSNNVIFNTHYYGREVSGSDYPWCAAFVWDVFRMSGFSEIYLDGGKTASCAAVYSFAKNSGRLVTSGYKRGDVILYKFDRTAAVANHNGIVTYASTGMLRAIEGNTAYGNDSNGGAVMERTRTFDYVIGAYRPDYKEDEMTYEQFEEFMARYLSIAGTGDECSDWATAATDSMRELGIVAGSEGDFGWKKPLTKETVAQMLYNYMENTKENNDG